MIEDGRNPDLFLTRLQEEQGVESGRGRLKIFFGASAGVGKTYSMLKAARKSKEEKIDVVIGYVETHGREETESLLEGLEQVPLQEFDYRGTKLKELDIDACLKRAPALILVDELAHTNAPGARHAKRYQDVQELLEAGIDVFTTVNVQHVESLHDVVAQITQVSVRERVPDSLFEHADEIELVDLPPEKLLERLHEGKVYVPERAKAALQNFFRKGNLIALREVALRYTAERVVADMEAYRKAHHIKHPWPAAEHLLVCVSPSPLATKLVRAAKRMAEALRAQFTVLYVEGRRQTPLPVEDNNRLNQTLRLAEQLGAHTIEIVGDDVADQIIKCAHEYNVSKIIVGKPARPRWKEQLFGSVVDDIIRKSGAIDVYVITGDEGEALPSVFPKIDTTSKTSDYIGALTVVVVCTLIARVVMVPFFEPVNIVMMYLLGVVVVAFRYGRGPSILASILSVATFDFFCVPPYLTFAVSDTQYVITFVVMLVVALAVSTLTVTIKHQAEASRLREMRTAALYSMSRDLSSPLHMSPLMKIGLRHIATIFNSQVALLRPDASGTPANAIAGEGRYELHDPDIGIAAWVNQNKQPAGLGTDTLPGAGELYLPLIGAQRSIGVLALKPTQPDRFLSPEQFRLLETFANQLAIACERTQLSEENEQAKIQVKTEQLRSSLLSSVSHDLRTPLATIAGAASSILEGTESLTVEKCKEMVGEIYLEAMRLNTLVGNLLDMTKLESGALQIIQEYQPVDEVVGSALSYVEERIKNHPIKTNVPDDLPLILVDEVLIRQVLANLYENATKYSPPGSEIEIAAASDPENGTVVISVADRGPGVRDENKKMIFEKFFREQPNKTNGVGLGLAICSGIIEAHGGKIWVEDRPGGGSIFKFSVPAGALPQELTLEEDELEQLTDA